jgi:hypothetical protein
VVEAVLRVGDASGRQRLATEAAALLFAEGHRLPAPRLLAADPDGDAAGRPALLMTLLPGTSTIPRTASVARLRAAGAAAARIHAVPAAPRPDLPSRVRRPRRTGTSWRRSLPRPTWHGGCRWPTTTAELISPQPLSTPGGTLSCAQPSTSFPTTSGGRLAFSSDSAWSTRADYERPSTYEMAGELPTSTACWPTSGGHAG